MTGARTGGEAKGAEFGWRARLVRWALLRALTISAVTAGCLFWEGHTFSIDLVNDTDRPLQFLQCDLDCDTTHQHLGADPGESHGVNNTVGVANLWQVQDEIGQALGCFRIEFDHRPRPDEDELYVSRDLGPCVR